MAARSVGRGTHSVLTVKLKRSEPFGRPPLQWHMDCCKLQFHNVFWSRGPKDVGLLPSVRDALAGRPAARIVSGGSLPNSRKPCHPEHSVSDFGFHDCQWQSYLRKMRSVVEGSTHCVVLCSPFRAKILRLRCAWLRMTAFLKCLNLCNKRSICRFV